MLQRLRYKRYEGVGGYQVSRKKLNGICLSVSDFRRIFLNAMKFGVHSVVGLTCDAILS